MHIKKGMTNKLSLSLSLFQYNISLTMSPAGYRPPPSLAVNVYLPKESLTPCNLHLTPWQQRQQHKQYT